MKKRKHILVVSQYFYPENFRINDMTQEWIKRGYEVTVLTGIPNYPIGTFFEGYGFFKNRKENWNGINVIRIPLVPRGKNSIGMILNYVSFVVSGFFWKIFTKIKADIVFTFEVSPMTQALIGVWYAKKHNIPHYLYVQDLWPENVMTVTGITNPLVINPINSMVDYIYKNTDLIFTTSNSFVDAICNRKKSVPRDKVKYWPQYAEEFYRPMGRCEMPEFSKDDKRFKIAFTGNIGTAQGLQVLPEVARLLNEEEISFVIVGDGRYKAEFERLIKDYKVESKFILIPRQNAERIPEILSNTDAAFISFQKSDLWEMTIPAKLQSYMACGKAIIASASGETKRIIEESGCGICCDIGDARLLAQGIRSLLVSDIKKMEKQSIEYFQNNFAKKKLMDEMEQYL